MSRDPEDFRRHGVLDETVAEPWGDGTIDDSDLLTIRIGRDEARALAVESGYSPEVRFALFDALRQAEGIDDAVLDLSDVLNPIGRARSFPEESL